MIMRIIILILFISPCLLSFGQIANKVSITQQDLTKVGTSIPASEIGEPVGSVKLYTPRWNKADQSTPAHMVVEGTIFPFDPNGWPINFRALLPASWSLRAIQQGGGGMNGVISVSEGNHPFLGNVNGLMLGKGIALYGSDSGHQAEMTFPGAPKPTHLATGPAMGDEWTLNEEAIRNLGYMQMKKTHDAVMVILQRVYGQEPTFNYYVGNSQGGREALTVAQRYPEDYEGIISNVPIVNFSTLMLGPTLMKIQEIPQENWVTRDKAAIITREFLKQCDQLDGLSDGIINNYVAAREIFNVNDGKGTDDPWAALRESGELTDRQIETLELTYSSYQFTNPLANGVTSFGMWTPTIEPGGFNMITDTRYKGQEGADENAPMFSQLGIQGVIGFLMQDLASNPLDYVEGGKWEERRQQISEWLDSTNPYLPDFHNRGGKIIITIGAIDNIASSGAQMDYYQSMIDEMGQDKLDDFARLYVVPNGNHILAGRSYTENGDGEQIEVKELPAPNYFQNIDLLMNWVENKKAPEKTLAIGPKGEISEKLEGEGYMMCSYPNYAKYTGGPAHLVSSYESETPGKK